MASSSFANSSYDVFINHRGPDFKNTFGLNVFLDREELQQGDYLNSQIKGAIFSKRNAESRWCLEELLMMFESRATKLPVYYRRPKRIQTASVPVSIFSRRYAESRWCLDELLMIFESKATKIPVFYHVTSDLRRTRGKDGVYARALRILEKKRKYDPLTHQKKLRHDPATVEKWRKALSDVSHISGFDLEACNGDEGYLLDEVARSVLKITDFRWREAPRYLVGLDEKVKDFEKKVFSENHHSAKPQVVGIVGLGGVGKTTLAKELFDRKRVDYSKFCILSNVRENARKGFLNSLQRQLLKSLTGTDVLINSIDEGIAELKKHLTSYPVFVILDDVDQLNQIDALLPVRADLLSDSLVLITSRDEKVIKSSGVENASIYQLTGLNDQHSRELFCAYAFSQSNPVEGFESLVDNFLEACDGLPLFLQVFGALLNNKYDQSDWKDLLDKLQQVLPSETQEKLQQVLPGETQEKLQISYQSLDMEQQQMLLDSACFFIGQKRDTAITIWEGSGWAGRLGFRTLEDRCLLGVDSENNIEMHDHLRDFGKAVADASLPRRLLHSTAIKDMLEQFSNEQVTNVPNEQVTTVRGIRVVLGEYYDDVYASAGIDTRTLELVDALGGIDMRTLQLVDTEDAILERILRRPICCSSLIWLRWNKCPDASLPSWIPMESLRVLQVSGSVLETLWKNEQVPLQLRELEINAPLSNIPKSIGRLEHLERIVVGRFLSGQVNLTKLPEEFCHLQSLKALVLTECSKMKSLPDSFDHLWNLQHVDLSFCRNLERLPDSIRYLRRLRHINLSDCHDLERLPDSIGGLKALQHIDLRGCHNLESLPDSFGELWDLRHINLSGCHDLQRLPDSFVNLRYLQHIDLQGCHNLQWLPDGFGDLINLEHVNLSNCHELEWLPDSLSNLRNLQYIDVSGCHNLERLPNFRNLNLNVEGCSNLMDETNKISLQRRCCWIL